MEERPWHRHYDYQIPAAIRYPRLPVHELLQLPANAFPDKPAFYFLGTEMTFRELRHNVLRLANALGALGVVKGERVGLHLPNCPQYPIAYYAALSLGAIVVNLNPMYTPDELKALSAKTGITTLITFDTVLPNIRALCQAVPISRVVVTRVTDYLQGKGQRTPAGLDLEEGWHYFHKLIEDCPSTKRPRVQVNPEDPALIQFTGGTTGLPKGAVLTHANVVAATLLCSLWGTPAMNLTPPEKRTFLAVLPFFHAYGNIVVMNNALLNCATQILVPRFQIDELIDLLAQFEKISFFPTVPTMINAIVNHPRALELQLDRKFGTLNSGAAPMPVELIEQVKDMGIYFSEGWGMSETTALGTANPILGLKKTGSIGIPFPDTDLRLVDLQEGIEEVPQGQPGEIIIKSPAVMKGYWDEPEETAGQLKDGWLHTGDVAVRDEEGYLFIVDRKKDMIIAGGFNIYPREIDEVLFQHPKIQEAVSVGIPDAYRGETVKAYIVLKTGETATGEEIITFCREKLAAYKVPKKIEFRDSLPKSAVGKVLRKILRSEEEVKRQQLPSQA
ncbi:MAG: long-chain fatty acid--CoA ligase [Deltaproteobacteria bacterium]|nr:long-chain fatty acid--CoA ligase [Deltaproteobacteria bacterium]